MEFDLTNVKLSHNDIKRGLTLPKNPSKELAEFIGILTGDGYINYYPYQYKYLLEIAGDSRFDDNYLTGYVRELVKRLFSLESSFFRIKSQNSMYLRLISKGLINYLVEAGFKKGKKEQITIPSWIISNEDYMLHFIKGLIDTDGSIHFRGNYPIISFASKSHPLVAEVYAFLKREGFILRM